MVRRRKCHMKLPNDDPGTEEFTLISFVHIGYDSVDGNIDIILHEIIVISNKIICALI